MRIDGDDIGGVVTSDKGPEAGVWVIAETTELPTKLAKMVVTDDQGRYVIPDLPRANYNVWVRGYGLIDSAKSSQHARENSQLESRGRAQRRRGGAVLSGDLLVFDAEDSRQEFVPWHRREGQRHAGDISKARGNGSME